MWSLFDEVHFFMHFGNPPRGLPFTPFLLFHVTPEELVALDRLRFQHLHRVIYAHRRCWPLGWRFELVLSLIITSRPYPDDPRWICRKATEWRRPFIQDHPSESFLGNQRNSSFFQKRQRVENAESYYDAGALVVWKMPRAPRGKPNGKAYRIYMHLPNLTMWGLLRTIFKEGLCSSLFYLALWTDVLSSGSQVLETERQAEVMHARRQLGRCPAISFCDQILIRS